MVGKGCICGAVSVASDTSDLRTAEYLETRLVSHGAADRKAACARVDLQASFGIIELHFQAIGAKMLGIF